MSSRNCEVEGNAKKQFLNSPVLLFEIQHYCHGLRLKTSHFGTVRIWRTFEQVAHTKVIFQDFLETLNHPQYCCVRI